MKRRAAQWFRTGTLSVIALALAGNLPAQNPPPDDQFAAAPTPPPAQTLSAQPVT